MPGTSRAAGGWGASGLGKGALVVKNGIGGWAAGAAGGGGVGAEKAWDNRLMCEVPGVTGLRLTCEVPGIAGLPLMCEVLGVVGERLICDVPGVAGAEGKGVVPRCANARGGAPSGCCPGILMVSDGGGVFLKKWVVGGVGLSKVLAKDAPWPPGPKGSETSGGGATAFCAGLRAIKVGFKRISTSFNGSTIGSESYSPPVRKRPGAALRNSPKVIFTAPKAS